MTEPHTDNPPADEGLGAATDFGLQGQLVLNLDGFEGPIDLLLSLSRAQKVDITKISILALAEQYLAFITNAQKVHLELAADYLVMAAWLAYLKSRLLLPDDHSEEQPSGQQMAEALAFQMQRLESMQEAGQRLFQMPMMGRDVFSIGAPEGVEVINDAVFEPSLYELMRSYGALRSRNTDTMLHITPQELFSVEQAVERLRQLLGDIPDWADLAGFLPKDLKGSLIMRSALASTFAATLELVRQGQAELRQDGAFSPIYIRARKKEQ